MVRAPSGVVNKVAPAAQRQGRIWRADVALACAVQVLAVKRQATAQARIRPHENPGALGSQVCADSAI
jgi:hypothetical protein